MYCCVRRERLDESELQQALIDVGDVNLAVNMILTCLDPRTDDIDIGLCCEICILLHVALKWLVFTIYSLGMEASLETFLLVLAVSLIEIRVGERESLFRKKFFDVELFLTLQYMLCR